MIVAVIDGVEQCKPTYNCPPGHYIRECNTIRGNRDVCTKCPWKQVQPDFISSFSNHTDCFFPTSICIARDITYRRTKDQTAACMDSSGCKCDNKMCFFGDPCLCDVRRKGCPPDSIMNVEGECERCPKGTSKAGFGCGPCYNFNPNKRLYLKRQRRSAENNSTLHRDEIDDFKTATKSIWELLRDHYVYVIITSCVFILLCISLLCFCCSGNCTNKRTDQP